MELQTLDGNFETVKMVENYKSLIWTERYSKAGDFQLTSNNVEETIDLLKLESFVRLKDSTVPMIVEAHRIEKKPREAPLLTVVGRSFETVLERRAAVDQMPGAYTTLPAWMIPALKSSDAAYQAIRVVLGDGEVRKNGSLVHIARDPAVSLLDAIPEVSITMPVDYEPLSGIAAWSATATYSAGAIVTYTTTVNLVTSTSTWRAVTPVKGTAPVAPAWESLMYQIKRSDLYSAVMELVVANHHGLKSVLLGNGKVGIEIYNGANLSGEAPTGYPSPDPNTVVAFDARFDQFDSSTYLLSKQGSANIGYVYGSTGAQTVLKTTSAEPAGLSRRVLVVGETTDTTLSTPEARRSRGIVELYKNNVTALYDGEISVQIAEGYNRDYFLGDILRLTGEYGLHENVRVAEFIRTSDSTGEKSYPTFEQLDDGTS